MHGQSRVLTLLTFISRQAILSSSTTIAQLYVGRIITGLVNISLILSQLELIRVFIGQWVQLFYNPSLPIRDMWRRYQRYFGLSEHHNNHRRPRHRECPFYGKVLEMQDLHRHIGLTTDFPLSILRYNGDYRQVCPNPGWATSHAYA